MVESNKAGDILGVKVRHTLDLGDASLMETDENIQAIVATMRELKPRFAFIQYPEDRHPDHVKGARLALQALFYTRLQNYPAEGEPFSISGYGYYIGNTPRPPHPTFIADISEVFDIKLEALKAYESQFYNPDFDGYPTYISSERYADRIKARAQYYGGLIGVDYGEPFVLDRPLNLGGRYDLLFEQEFL
jgi:bacillithiol biosynthesis deacetylase BshB1